MIAATSEEARIRRAACRIRRENLRRMQSSRERFFSRDVKQESGPEAFLRGVIKHAVQSIEAGLRGTGDAGEADASLEWIKSDDRSDLFCFASICDALHVDHEEMRAKILEQCVSASRRSSH